MASRATIRAVALITAQCKCRRRCLGFVLALVMLLCCSAGQSYSSDTLECPEIGPGSVPSLIGDASGGALFTTENRVDLANEINEQINRLQIASPDISWSEVQNVLIAAYCRVVAREPGSPLPRNGTACAGSTASWNARSRRT